MYDITSSCADDFINHEEILDTLAYADQNKENSTLIDSIIQKAKKRKGLSHRQASVLLACPIPEKNEEIFRLAEQIKKDFYGNRIVMFAPLYLSNFCINGCLSVDYGILRICFCHLYFCRCQNFHRNSHFLLLREIHCQIPLFPYPDIQLF